MPTKSKAPAASPERTCVVTRRVAPSRELVHVVPDETGLVRIDLGGHLDGRGAWLSPERAVFEEAERRPGTLMRALKRDDIVVAGLLDRVRAAMLLSMMDLLSLAARSGRLASGADQVSAAAKGGDLCAFLVASDASPQSLADARKGAQDIPVFPVPLDREALGRRIGKGPRAVVGVRPGGPSALLVDRLRRMTSLG